MTNPKRRFPLIIIFFAPAALQSPVICFLVSKLIFRLSAHDLPNMPNILSYARRGNQCRKGYWVCTSMGNRLLGVVKQTTLHVRNSSFRKKSWAVPPL